MPHVDQAVFIDSEVPKILRESYKLLQLATDTHIRMGKQERLELQFKAGVELNRAHDESQMSPRVMAQAMAIPNVNHLTIYYCRKIAQTFGGNVQDFKQWNNAPGRGFKSLKQVYEEMFPNKLRNALKGIRNPLLAIKASADVLHQEVQDRNSDKSAQDLIQAVAYIRELVPPTESLHELQRFCYADCVCCGANPPHDGGRHKLYRVALKEYKVPLPICNACEQAKSSPDYMRVARLMYLYAQHAYAELDELTKYASY